MRREGHKVVAGTRGSALARAQTQWVLARLGELDSDLQAEMKIITTSGDRDPHRPLHQVGGKGLFVREIEEALLAGTIDLAVHSMKDLPTTLPAGLSLGCVPQREDPLDVLLLHESLRDRLARFPAEQVMRELPAGAALGTSSLRRRAQLLHHRPDLNIRDLRGNVDTRLRKLQEQGLAGIVLAAAGLRRLAIDLACVPLSPELCLPAVGQGALGIEVRDDRDDLKSRLNSLEHMPSRVCITAERAFLCELGGGCNVSAAAYAQWRSADTLVITAMVASPDGLCLIREQCDGRPEAAEKIGRDLAATILAKGGAEILQSAREAITS